MVSGSVYLIAARACTTKLCWHRRGLAQGPFNETKHRLVVQASTAATYTDSKTALGGLVVNAFQNATFLNGPA